MCSYGDVSVKVALWCYAGYDELIGFSLCLTLYPSKEIMCTGIRYYGSDIVAVSCSMTSSIPGTRYCLFILCNIFIVSYLSVTFNTSHLMSLLTLTLFFVGAIEFVTVLSMIFCVSYHYHLEFLSIILPLNLSLLVMYEIRPNSEN